MALLQNILIFFACLIILARLPQLIWPGHFREYLRLHVLRWPDLSLQLAGLFAVLIGGFLLFYTLDILSLSQIIVSFLILAIIVAGILTIILPKLLRTMLKWLVYQPQTMLRTWAVISIMLALGLLYLALSA